MKLAGFADRKAETYSGGQRRIFDLASGVVNAPELLFLDEPTTGLDPQSRALVWNEVKGVHAQGTTVFLTTHYLEEADALCDRVAIVDRGTIVALGSPAELKKEIAGDIITLAYGRDDQAKAAAHLLAGHAAVLEHREIGAALQVYVDRGDEALPVNLRIVGQGPSAQIRPSIATVARRCVPEAHRPQLARRRGERWRRCVTPTSS